MLDCQRTSDIQNRLKMDMIVDLKTHQENWLDHLKKNGYLSTTKTGSPIAAQGTTGHRMPSMKMERPRTSQALKAKNIPSFK